MRRDGPGSIAVRATVAPQLLGLVAAKYHPSRTLPIILPSRLAVERNGLLGMDCYGAAPARAVRAAGFLEARRPRRRVDR